MNLRDLKYLIAVAKEQHFARAAAKSFVSQPTLSMQIKKLEDELEVKIFERSKNNFLVTKTGREIIKKAEIIIREAEEIKNIAKNSKDPFSGEIRIGAFPTLASYFFPKIIPQISKKFPRLKLLLIEEKTDELLQKLKNGEIDAAFIVMPLEDNSLASKKIFTEEFLLAVPKNHLLNKKNKIAKKIQSKDLKGQSLMLLEEGHCLREQALEACSMLGTFEQQDFRATSLETLRQMIINGAGITLMPKIAVKKEDKISYLEIKDAPKRTIGLYWRDSSPRQNLMQELAEIAMAKI
ncbi:MAG: LysR substrate-binding domain-containing protein [Rickettsiales bacterium]|nr:LysR substrate-binding domain-containing protein [Rickettsiales bacterium]